MRKKGISEKQFFVPKCKVDKKLEILFVYPMLKFMQTVPRNDVCIGNYRQPDTAKIWDDP